MSVGSVAPERGLGRFLYELREGARKQGGVVFALIFREVKSRSKNGNYGLLSLVAIALEPALYVLIMAAFWYAIRRQEIFGVHIFLFVAVSLTAFSMVRRSIASVPRSMRSSSAFYAYPNVKPFDAVLARFLLETALVFLGGGMVLLFGWWFLGLSISDEHLLEALGIFLMLIAAAFGLSLFFGVYGMIFPMVLTSLAFCTRGLFLLSAVINPAAALPPQVQWYLAFNPLAHAMELLRFYTLKIPPFPQVSFRYFAFFCLASLFMGLIAYYANRSRVLER